MKEIIGDDYPTYEESVNMTLAEKAKTSDLTLDSACTYLNEVEQRIHKENMERLIKENFELRHRLSCIEGDIELISAHICRYDKDYIFKKPSLNPDGSTYADEAWHNVSNIEIACDLNDDEPLHWGSKVMAEKLNKAK